METGISYIILNYNDYETTKKCVDYIKHYDVLDHIIVVDNCSTDDSYKKLLIMQNNKIVVIKSDKNGGYGYGNNYGARYAHRVYDSKYIIIGNPDAFIDEEDIDKCYQALIENEICACVAPLMYDQDNTPNYKCVWRIPKYYEYCLFPLVFGRKINFWYPEQEIKKNSLFYCDCVAGSWLMLDFLKFENAGMYDESLFLYCEETVLGIKLKNEGYKTAVVPNASFLHLHSASISKSFKSTLVTNKMMWKSRLFVLDNYYNPSAFARIFSRVAMALGIIEKYASNLKNHRRYYSGKNSWNM